VLQLSGSRIAPIRDSAFELHLRSAMGDDAQKKQAKPAATPKKSSKAALAWILIAAGAGGSAAWYLQQRAGAASHRDAEASAAPKYIVHLEGFTVNLADPEQTHFLRATIDLGIDRLPDGADKEKPSQAIPVARVRDAILSVLTVCKADDLLTADGKTELKQNLLKALNKSVPELGVREIYFTEFLVQR
jgi:flagellar FliL protein